MLENITEYFADPLHQLRYEGPILGVATLLIIWVFYKLSRRALSRYLHSRPSSKSDNIQQFLFIWRYIWLGLAAILGIITFSGSLATLGISAAFLGMILGWSLQAPVTGIAAWLMIILKQPFKIGDRVIIAGIIGDVVDITLTHVLLNQVGGTIGGEEKSGRAVLIPNATLFQQIIYNYTLEGFGPEEDETSSNYILDEVPVRLTFGSDFDEAEKILLAAARQVTSEIISETRQEPFMRAELFESGILMRLRYQTLAKERQRITSDIVRVLIREFDRNNKVHFCYPHMDIYYTPRNEG
ncbi:MAG: mechanosensitive ion channel family protein [Candidatus Latescibacteria bacterium]|nr:mechanosensitive ion channel family protein [Candidatus Latescibacterota bacterium]